MYLHLGNNISVYDKNIIAIMDIENASTSKITKEYLSQVGRSKQVIYCSYDMPKSFVVTLDDDLTERVYISSLASRTLIKRIRKAEF
ncbi:MAG: DUF370 domain-containing protein [Oscillospiraceae bacterium]|nr:DUF370 domain-containing protein [Oscillospiraceae bacterium]